MRKGETTMSKQQCIQRDIDRFLDGFLSDSREEVHTISRREDFAAQWYEYEEESIYNFF